MPNSELSKYVYVILDQGQVIIATLDAEEDQHRMDRRPTVTQLGTGHKYPAAMVFPATPANYDALQILYEDIKVPPIPMEPNDIVHKLLESQFYVLIKNSSHSYDDARTVPNSGARIVRKEDKFLRDHEAWKYMVPYDVWNNEITSLDYVKGDTNAK